MTTLAHPKLTCQGYTDTITTSLSSGGAIVIDVWTDSEYRHRVNGQNLMIGSGYLIEGVGYMWMEHPDFRRQRPLRPGEEYPDVVISKANFFESWLSDGYTFQEGGTGGTRSITLRLGGYFAPSDFFTVISPTIKGVLLDQASQDGAIRLSEPLAVGTISTPDGELVTLMIDILDIAKCGPPGGLKSLAESAGVSMGSKDTLDEWKHRMDDAYLNPEMQSQWVDYCRGDVEVLPVIFAHHQKRYPVLATAIGIHSTSTREWGSTGSMIAALDIAYIQHKCDQAGVEPWTHLSCRKWGKTQPFELTDMLDKASVKYFAGVNTSDKAYLALVQGGLAKSFKPMTIKVTGLLADWDMAGAYSTCQQNMDYIVGLPHTFGLHENSKGRQPSLEAWVKQHAGQLVPRAWFAVVSGKHGFAQSLIPSKYTDKVAINKYKEDDQANITGVFELLTHEVINGIITSDVLAVLKMACTPVEFSRFMKGVTVTAAAWYPASHHCETPEKWNEMVGACGNTISETTDKQGVTRIVDSRSKHWYSFPLKDILAPWAEMRGEHKKALKKAKGLLKLETDVTEQARLAKLVAIADATQADFKLAGNTHYGVQASPDLPVSNVVVANNITAMCRVGVWLAVQALDGYQTITDGFVFDTNKVSLMVETNNGLPGMATLTRRHYDNLTRDEVAKLQSIPLVAGGLRYSSPDTTTGKVATFETDDGEYPLVDEGYGDTIDAWATAHILQFWQPRYGDTPPAIFAVIKSAIKSVCQEAIFHGQTNYRLTDVNGAVKLKVRGHKASYVGKSHVQNKNHIDPETGEPIASKMFDLFDSLAANPQSLPPQQPCEVTSILKVNQYKRMQASSKPNLVNRGHVCAGDTVTKQVWIRPISLSMFWYKTHAQREAWVKRGDKLKQATGWGIEGVFIQSDGTVDYQKAIEAIQGALNRGDNWVVDLTRDASTDHPHAALAGQHQNQCRI